MCVGMKANKELVGNLIILLAGKCRPLYLTKLLKLLFLIDEEAVKRTGAPITWLSYQAWQFGPVVEDIFYSKNTGHNRFNEFVAFRNIQDNKCIIDPVAEFDDSEFSDLDLEIINDVFEKYGLLNTSELVKIVHAKNSLWHTTIEREGIQFSEDNKTSEIELDFTEQIKDDFKKTVYYSTLENMEIKSTLR